MAKKYVTIGVDTEKATALPRMIFGGLGRGLRWLGSKMPIEVTVIDETELETVSEPVAIAAEPATEPEPVAAAGGMHEI